MDYDSCWLYPPPKTCPQTTFPRKYMRGPAVKAGNPFLLLPSTLPKERGDKRQNHRKQKKRTPGKAKTPRPVLEMGPPLASPLQKPCGRPWPPLLPSHLAPPPLGAFFPFLFFIAGYSDHLSNLRSPKEGQHRFSCPFVTEEQCMCKRSGFGDLGSSRSSLAFLHMLK